MKFSLEHIFRRREVPLLTVSMVFLLLGAHLAAQAQVVLVFGGDTIDLICGDEGEYQLHGSNSDGVPGRFELVEDGTYLPVPGHIDDGDPDDNTAVLKPSGLSGDYGIIYSYEIDLVTFGDSCWFRVDEGSVELPGLPETVCKNDAPYALSPVTDPPDPDAVYFFDGPGVSGSQDEGFFFNPVLDEVPVGSTTIKLIYTASSGCQKDRDFTIKTGYVPTIIFSVSPSCISAEGEEVRFSNLTIGSFAVKQWDWNFGDPESGSANYSTAKSPTHYYSRPGTWDVRLKATTEDGCVAEEVRRIDLFGKPVADFSWLHDCYISGDSTSFLNTSLSEYAEIDALVWTCFDSSGGLLGQIVSNQADDTIRFPLISQEEYSVSLFVASESGCNDETSRSISLKPLYVLSSAGYTETFNGEGLEWEDKSETVNESWELGLPNFTGYSAEEDDLSWYTDLPAQTEGYIENSWVESPCFDLSEMNSPMVQLDLMRSFVPGTDGSVLQYQDLVTEGWKTIGTVGNGLNWYNSWGIFNKPGGSSFGWGLPLFQPDTEWLHAGYSLDQLARKPFVKFRVVIGSGGGQAIGNQGFAFDNFFLGERVRTSLLEHFTNSGSQAAIDADVVVEQFVKDNFGMVIDLQYHMDYPGEDPMNLNNPEPPSVRSFNYGVPGVPYALLNGGREPSFRYDFSDSSEEPDGTLLLEESLKVPPFDLELSVDYGNYKLAGEVIVSCSEESYASNIQLYVVVIEELISAYTGVSETVSFRNVVLDILPGSTGKLLGNDWSLGDSAQIAFQWNYAAYVEDIEDLSVIAYLFDRDQNKVLQAREIEYSPPVGIAPVQDPSHVMAIYPNPARDFVYVNLGSQAKLQGELRIVDASGRLLMLADVSPGQLIRHLDISSLDQGFYLLQWIELGRLKGYGRLIRAR